MKNSKHRLIALSTFLLVLSSCSYRVIDFTLISSKNVDITKCGSFIRGKDRVKGKDMVHWIVIIPTGTVDIKNALDRAIESTPGCVALLDGVIYGKFWWIPYIYGQHTVTVEGTPLIDPSIVINSTETPTYGKIELNRKGEVKNVEQLTSYEYLALKGKIVKESQEIKFANSDEVKQH